MHNRWNVEKENVIGWSARLDARFLPDALRLARECGVFEEPDSPALDGCSRVAYYAPDGEVVEDRVCDLGAVLAAGPHVGLLAHRPPLRLWADRGRDGVELRISSCSDIWLPWCSTRFEQDAHIEDFADNRELAGRHTPRLNAFLAGVTDLVRESGGQMEVEPDNTLYLLGFQIDASGVRLDADHPRERTAWERFGHPGGRELTDALLGAAGAAERFPPPSPYRAAVGVWSTDEDHALHEADRDVVRDALRATGIWSVLDGTTRVKVLAGEVQHTFEPGELAP